MNATLEPTIPAKQIVTFVMGQGDGGHLCCGPPRLLLQPTSGGHDHDVNDDGLRFDGGLDPEARRPRARALARRDVRRPDRSQVYVSRGRKTRRAARGGASQARRAAGRPRRDAHVESPGAPRGLSRGTVDGSGPAHAQPAAVVGAACVRDRARAGQGRHRRRSPPRRVRRDRVTPRERRAHPRRGRRRRRPRRNCLLALAARRRALLGARRRGESGVRVARR